MPYILPKDRFKYRTVHEAVKNLKEIETKGDLEYLVYLLQLKFMQTREERYSTLHEATYAVVHAGHEFQRQYLDKRENEAKDKNGDIKL